MGIFGRELYIARYYRSYFESYASDGKNYPDLLFSPLRSTFSLTEYKEV
jgi:hypothetical protein